MNIWGKRSITFLQYATGSLMMILLVTLTWQVFSRYVLKNPSTVTEELSRILLMWLASLGTALGFLGRQHIAFDLLSEKCSGKNRRRLREVSDVCVVLFGLLMLVGGSALVWQKWSLGQTSAVMKLPYVYVYLVMPIAGFFITLAPFIGTQLEPIEAD